MAKSFTILRNKMKSEATALTEQILDDLDREIRRTDLQDASGFKEHEQPISAIDTENSKIHDPVTD